MDRYFLEPYRFIPPFRSTFWCRVAGCLIPRHLRKAMGIRRWHFEGLHHLRESLDRRAGVLLAPNHCRWADPMVLGVMGAHLRQYLYFVASYHLFRQGRLLGWFLNRMGGYSIWREGADRESLRATARILADAERPVVLFPEGTWFRQNDRVGPLQEGLSLITREAVRQTDRPLILHPVGIKYWCLAGPTTEIESRLTALERRLGWRPQKDLHAVARIEKLGGALVALKEIELLGGPRTGGLDERIRSLVEGQVGQLERQHLGKPNDGWTLERIRRLRQALMRRLLDTGGRPQDAIPIKADLDLLLFCENLNAHSMEYLHEWPSPERLCETIQRIEETLTDGAEAPVVPLGAAVQIGPPLDLRALPSDGRKASGPDPFIAQLRRSIQGCVDHLLAKGPPPEWACPPGVPRPATSTNGVPPAPPTAHPVGEPTPKVGPACPS